MRLGGQGNTVPVMPATAASVGVRGESPARVASGVRDALARVRNPAGAIAFVCGDLAARVPAIAAKIADVARDVPVAIAPGAGVLTQDGEIEGQSAAAVIAWAGGRTDVVAADARGSDELGDALARAVSDRAGKSEPPVLLFARPEGFGPQTLEPLQEARGARNVFGAGTVGPHPPLVVGGDGSFHEGAAVALLLRGLAPPSIRASHACRLLGPLRTITEIRGNMVVRIDDEPALDVLGNLGAELEDQPLVFAVLASEVGSGPEQGGRPQLVVRAVQGVDPVRRSLMVSNEVREGLRMTFAIRDGSASRQDLETVTRDLQREIAGAAPRFGVYLNCSGRGSSLYNAYDVDSRILKNRFRDVPLAGMQSSFEIAPHLGKPTLQLYTGVLGLFTSPS